MKKKIREALPGTLQEKPRRKPFLLTALLTAATCMALIATPALAQEPDYHDATKADQKLFEQVLEANTMENHLSLHGTFQENSKIYNEKGKLSARYLFWGSPDGAVYSDDHGAATLITPTIVLNRTGKTLYEYFLIGEGAYEEQVKQQLGSMTLTLMQSERLVQAGEDEGYLYMVTEADDQRELENYLNQIEALATDVDYRYQDGMVLRFYTAFDKENHEIMANDVALVMPDGSEKLLQKLRYAYDLQYDISTSPFAEYYDKSLKQRQIQVYLLTEDGQSGTGFRYTIPQGVYFDLFYQDGFPAVYTDPQCQTPYDFKNTDTADNLTLFIRPDGK